MRKQPDPEWPDVYAASFIQIEQHEWELWEDELRRTIDNLAETEIVAAIRSLSCRTPDNWIPKVPQLRAAILAERERGQETSTWPKTIAGMVDFLATGPRPAAAAKAKSVFARSHGRAALRKAEELAKGETER